jgi:hypothetical protein
MQPRRPLPILVIFLLLAVVNYSRIKGSETVRPILFLSILAIGILTGLLIRELAARVKKD